MSQPLQDDEIIELGELLGFLHDWIDHAPDLGESLGRFTGGGYTLEELRADLARLAFLLGGDGHRFIHGADQ
jgi:hypothetical protein